ncbi:MAG TPA: hypothetical protein VEX15_06630 [Nocardioidaceae bacterium]|nr:hypothetical protein [Nocardioidaceae bacterium]
MNGQTVAETTDSTKESGHAPLPAVGTVDLFVDARTTGAAAEVQFDNFVVTQV